MILVESIAQRNSLYQMVKDPTGEQSVLDLLLTNTPERISNIALCEGLSDHKSIIINLDVNLVKHRKPKRKI